MAATAERRRTLALQRKVRVEPAVTVFIDTADNLHPYECNGPGACIHCDRRRTEEHDPDECALCEETR